MSAEMKVVLSADDKTQAIDGVQAKIEKLGNGGGGAIGRLTGKVDDLARIGIPGMNSLAGAFGKVGAAQSSFLGTAGIAVAGLGAIAVAAGAFAAKSISAASEAENLRVRLDAMTGSSAKGAAAMEEITKRAALLPATLTETAEAAVSLQAFGADIGTWLGPLGDVAGYMGMKLPEAAQAMGRAFAGGAGAADIFRERGVLSMISMKTGIDDLTKLSLPEFRKVMLEVFTDVDGGIAGMAEKQSKTFAGMMSMLADESGKLLKAVGGVLLPMAKEIVGALTSVATAGTKMITELLIIDKITAASKEAAEAEEKLASVMASLAPAAAKAAGPVETLGAALRRQLNNAKTVADSWKDSLQGLEKDFATATANIKTRQAEFDAWIDKTAANAAARKAGGLAIGSAGMTDAERQAQADARAQQLMLEATRETGEKRVALLNQAAEYFEQAKAAEVAADLAAMQQMAANDAAQWELDRTSLQAALQAKTEMYMAEQQRLSDWIAEESAATANAKAAELQTAVDTASAVEAKIAEVSGRIADVNAEIGRMDALLKDEKKLALNAEEAKIDMERVIENVIEADAQIKAPHKFDLETAAAETKAKALRAQVDALFPPEGLHRVVIVEYKTKASPIRPFTEGMEDIKRRMLDLPTESAFTVRASGIPGSGVGVAAPDTIDFPGAPDRRGGGGDVNLTAHITVSAAGGSAGGVDAAAIAKTIDEQFAELYRSNRSKLRLAMKEAAA